MAKEELHAVKSDRVNAPVITEYPLTLECEVVEIQQQPYGLRVLGRIINVIADEKILDEKGKIDAGKIQAFAFDQMKNGYYAIGEKVGQAWHSGAEYMKKNVFKLKSQPFTGWLFDFSAVLLDTVESMKYNVLMVYTDGI